MVKRSLYLLLLTAWVIALMPGLAHAEVAPPRVLAQVFFSGRLDALPLPVTAHWQSAVGVEVVLVIAPLADLQRTGLPFRVLDAEAQPGGYYLAHRRMDRASALQPGALNFGKALLVDGSRLLVRATQAQAEHLILLGFELQWLGDVPVTLFPASVTTAAALAHDESLVGEILAQVLERTLHTAVSGLSGESAVTIGGAPYTITTRYTNSGTPITKATQYAYEQLQALGLSVSYHPWTLSGYSNRNVIGVINGTTHADEIVLITAHLDSVSNRDTPSNNPAPGADDNASGSAAVLLAADILSRYNLDRTVRFVLFTGEEQGLLGAYAYAATVQAAGDNIVAVYNMDMLAWDALYGPDLDLFTRTASSPGYAADMAIANTFASIVSTYALDLTPNIRSTGMGSSDHYPFWQRGYSAILAIEDYTGGDFNTYYHRSTDRLQAFNMPYYVDFVKASMGTAARLGGVTRRYPFRITTTAAPDPMAAGELFTYTVLLTNTARSATTGIVVRTTLPADVTFLGASDGGSLEGEAVFWRSKTLAVGATLPLTIQMRAGCIPSGTLLAGGATRATALSWPVAATGAPVTVTVTAEMPEADFSFEEPVIREHPVIFTNLSQNATDYLWDFGDGVTTTVTAPTHGYMASGPVTPTLTASNSCFTDTVSRRLNVHDFDVSLAPALSERQVEPGATVIHTLWLTNTGTLTDTYTLGLTGGVWTATLSAPTVGPLAPGAAMIVTVTVAAPSEVISGTVDVATLEAISLGDPRTPPASATAELRTRAWQVPPPPEYGVSLAPALSEGVVRPGTSVTYTLWLTNTGTVTDTFELNLSGAAWTTTLSAPTVGPLAPGAAVLVTVTVAAPSEVISGTVDVATLEAVSLEDPRTPPVSATAELRTRAWQVPPPPEYGVSLAPALSEGAVRPGASVTYTLWLTNTGTVTDNFALSLTGGRWASALSMVTAGPLAPSATTMFSVTVTAPLSISGDLDTVTVNAVSLGDAQQPPVAATAQLRTRTLWAIYLPLTLRDFPPAR